MSYKEAIEFGNLLKAGHKVCNNVRWKDSVVGFEHNIIKNTIVLHNELQNGTYKIQPYQKFVIYEPKKREIVATRIRDRQFQRSLCDHSFYEEITRSFIHDNCACLEGKGIDFALNRMTAHLRRHFNEYGTDGYYLKCDIHHFFNSISHDYAKKCVDKRVKDKDTVKAVNMIIDSFGGEVGIGLGSQISQLVALAVLDDLDHIIKEKLHIKGYIRFMDDFILIHHDKEYLKYCKAYISDYLNNIGLELNRKTRIDKITSGVVFLQWRFKLTDTGRVLRLMSKKREGKQRRKLRKIKAKEASGRYEEGCVRVSFDSWIANAKRGDTFRQREKMKTFINDLEANYAKSRRNEHLEKGGKNGNNADGEGERENRTCLPKSS